VEEMNGAGAGADAQLALLDAAVICKPGLPLNAIFVFFVLV
jgi:hypothetical protein